MARAGSTTTTRACKEKLADITGYAAAPGVPNPALMLMAKFGVIVSEWMTQLDLDATAIQCWSSLQKNYGVNCCTIMSMMSEKLMPSACEVDVAGTVAMYALQLASGRPSALVDWNNNYGDDPDKCVFFHCGNWAKAFLPDITIAHGADPGHDARRAEHLRRARGSHAERAGHFRAGLDRRSGRAHPRRTSAKDG